jgi:CheY-like chemotaxis protein
VQPSAAILIVDDHDGFRTFARGTLEPADFTVTEAATGAEAADAARTIRPGLVLLDIQLPDSDGFEVARRLAAAPAGDPAPVAVLTSTREARDYGRAAASPAAGFLPKDQLSGAALHRFLARTCREPPAAGRDDRGRDRRGGRPRRSRPCPVGVPAFRQDVTS